MRLYFAMAWLLFGFGINHGFWQPGEGLSKKRVVAAPPFFAIKVKI